VVGAEVVGADVCAVVSGADVVSGPDSWVVGAEVVGAEVCAVVSGADVVSGPGHGCGSSLVVC